MEMNIIYHIKNERRKRYLTLSQLSELSGVSKSQINDVERNNKHPTTLILCLIASALEVNPCDLFTVSSVITDKQDKI